MDVIFAGKAEGLLNDANGSLERQSGTRIEIYHYRGR